MRVRSLVVRFRTPIRLAVLIGSLALMVAGWGVMLKWWPTPTWAVATNSVGLATWLQTMAAQWIRQGPVFGPMAEHWSVRLVEVGAVLALAFLELPTVIMMLPQVAAHTGYLLLDIPLFGLVIFAFGALAAGFHYNAAETKRTVREYQEAHE